MLYAAFHRMKKNQGGLISFNNFLSTSTSKQVALCFAQNALNKSEKVAILFEMTIDPSISSVPFASLDKLSYFQEKEKEILFSMHTVFRIGKIKPLDDNNNNSRFWHVYLTLTDADDKQLRQLTEHMRMDLSSFFTVDLQINMDPTWRLSKLLLNMGEYDKAIIIYEILLDKATRDNNLDLIQAIHYQLTELFMLHKKDWNRAREHLKMAFCIKVPDGNDVADEVKNDIIVVFSTIKNVLLNEEISEDEFHSIMVELVNKLVTLYLDNSTKPLCPLNYQIAVDRYNYIGWVRKKQGKISEAWTSHEQAMQILRKYLPPTHPRLAVTYNYISLLYSAMNDHSSAFDCLEKALHIQEQALQPNHPYLAETHFNMSIIFERSNKVDDVFQHAKKAIDIGHQAFLTSDDPQMKMYQEQFDKILLLIQSCNELVL
ncbi:unnamed protein product [Rotaria sp. Silwood2]|nr:unnamed protein product [Rotaria sp. Silwood2]